MAAVLACVALLLVTAHPPAAGAGDVSATVVANPLTLVLDVPPEPVETGRRIRAVATVANAGASPVTDVVLTIHTPGAVRVYRDATASIRRIRGDGSAMAAWHLCVDEPLVNGGYILTVTGEAVGPTGETYPIAGGAAVLTATAGRRPCR